MKRIILNVDDEIILREYILSDAKAIFELIHINREHLSKNGDDTSGKYPTMESVLESIAHPKDPFRFRFGIWIEKNIFAGSVNITLVPENQAELGYWIGKQFEGKGLITRASRRLIQYSFETSAVSSILAWAASTNDRSTNVLKKLGFEETMSEKEGILNFSLERWTPFWLDTNRYYGVINNKSEWRKVVSEKYKGSTDKLKKMLSNSLNQRGITDFGEGAAYTSLPTLGRWAEKNKMNLEI